MGWENIGEFAEWQRKTFPASDTPVGREFLAWLLREDGEARPLSEFYDGGFSHDLLRPILQEYVERGLVTWDDGQQGMSERSLRATVGLEAALSEHSVRLASLIRDMGGE